MTRFIMKERVDILLGFTSYKRGGSVKDKRHSRWNHKQIELLAGDIVEFNDQEGELTILSRREPPEGSPWNEDTLREAVGVVHKDKGKFKGAILKGWAVRHEG